MNDWNKQPKTELHLHIEGAAPPDFIRQLAVEKNVDLSRIFTPDGDYKWQDFATFLRTYEAATSVLQTPEDFRRLTLAVLDQCAANGVIYAELFLAADFCGGGDPVAWREYLAAIFAGADAARAKTGIECRFISTCVRHFGPEAAVKIARLSADSADDKLTGFGMGGEERHLRAADFAPAFDIAREAGLGLTSHAGEICGAESVLETLDALKVSRIGHGVRAVEDAGLVKRLAEENILLEVCPGSNIALSVYPDWPSHPVEALRKAGVPIAISTDDPPYFGTDMTHEYENLATHFGWGQRDFDASNRAAMQAAFCDETTRQKLLARFG